MSRIVVTKGFGLPDDFAALVPDDEVVVIERPPYEGAARAEVAIGSSNPNRAGALIAAAPMLRWYHCMAVGVERILEARAVPERVTLTNNRGICNVPIAEHVMATIFAICKRLPEHLSDQSRHAWGALDINRELRDSTLVILGQGSIGGELARLAACVGMRVVGVRRSSQDGTIGPERLVEVAARADFLAVCAPLTPETLGLVSAEVIARLPPNAWVINIARGPIVDEPALLAACRERRIGGAAIDTWWQEPLPPESEWWSLPNVIATPHVSHTSPRATERTVALILENLRRFKHGEPLLNRIDIARGY